jgi:hypothetical protein
MSDPSITATPKRRLERGSFQECLEGRNLLVPESLLNHLQGLGIRTGYGLLSYAHTFPSSLGAVLGWTNEELTRAKQRLAATLGVSAEDLADGDSRPDDDSSQADTSRSGVAVDEYLGQRAGDLRTQARSRRPTSATRKAGGKQVGQREP